MLTRIGFLFVPIAASWGALAGCGAPDADGSASQADTPTAGFVRGVHPGPPAHDAGWTAHDDAGSRSCPPQACHGFQHWDSEECACAMNAVCKPERPDLPCPDGYVCMVDPGSSCAGEPDCLGICMPPGSVIAGPSDGGAANDACADATADGHEG